MKFIKSKKKILIASVVLVLLTSLIAFAVTSHSKIPVEVYQVQAGTVLDLVEETAVVKTRNERIISAEVAATLEELRVEPGDRVVKGDLLAVLDIENIELQIAQLEAQKASLEAQVKEAKRVDTNVSAQLDAEKKSAFATYETTKRAYDQNISLFESGAVSASVLSDSKDKMTIAYATYESANQVYLQQRKGLSKELIHKYDADIKVLDYKIQSIRNQRQKFELKAPFDGVVTEKYVDTQAVLAMGSPILEIVDETSKYLETDVLASNASKLSVGTKVIAIDEDIDLNATGTITKVYPKAFSKTSDLGIEQKRVRIEIELDQSMESMKIGYETDLEVVLEEQSASLRIPDTAAFKMNKEWHVFVVNDSRLEVRMIQVGLEGQDYFEVESGLSSGEDVVVSPENELESGTRVSIEL